jgi:hypothetical protein
MEKNRLSVSVAYAFIINTACTSDYIDVNGSVVKKALDFT